MKDGKIELFGRETMNHDLLNKIEMLLSEDSYEQQKEETEKFIRNSRIKGNRAEDRVDDDITEDEEEEETIFDKARKEIEDEDEEKVKTPDESPSTINLADAVDFNKLIKLLNQFRASKSLTDKAVYQELSKYFHNKLTTEEKQVLYVLVKGLVQITLLDVDGKAAYAPSDLKFNIEKSGSATSEKLRSIRKKQEADKESASKMSNSPIKIGEAIQEKSNILSIVRRNND